VNRRTARGNRFGLGLIGVLLIIGGVLALVRGVGLLPGLSADRPLLSSDERNFAQSHSWFWYVVAVIAVLIALLAVRWLFVQGRRGAVRLLRIDADPVGRTRLSARAVSKAVERDIGRKRGIRRVTASLVGSPSAPSLRLSVMADPRCDWMELRTGITEDVLRDLAHSLELDRLPAVIRIRFATTSTETRELA